MSAPCSVWSVRIPPGPSGGVAGPWTRVVSRDGEAGDRPGAETAGGDHVVESGERRSEPDVVGRVDPHPGLLGSGDDLLRLGDVGRQRLLTHHARSRGDGGHGQLVMAFRRGADIGRVHTVQRFFQRVDGLGTEFARQIRRATVLGVDAYPRAGAQPRIQMQTCDQARADQRDLQLSHGLPDFSRRHVPIRVIGRGPRGRCPVAASALRRRGAASAGTPTRARHGRQPHVR